MKKTILSLLMVAATGIANAAILAYEPFSYPVGAINNGAATTATGIPTATTGGGFSGTWFAGGVGTTIVGGLTYSGLQTASNALQWSASVPYQGENLATQLFPATTPTVYVSFLYNAPSFTANKSGFAVDNGAGNNTGYYMGMTAAGTFGVATVANGSGTVLGTAAGSISYGTTYFIVVRFDANTPTAGTYYKSGSIWINPTPGGSEPAASGTFTGTYTAMNKIADFLTALGGSAVITDEIRLGTTWADVTPLAGATPPSIPAGLTVTSSGANTVSLSWTASTGSPTSYNVKRATSSGGTYTTVGTTTAPAVTFTDSVTGGATYYYAVSAVNVAGESANSSFVSATPTLGVPGAPTGLAASPANNQVALSWTAPAVGSPTSYQVLRGPVSGTYTVTNTTASTSYTDATAVNGTLYFYVVRAVNATGTGASSSEVSATPAAFANLYEPFNYASITTGTAGTGNGESGTWTAGANTIATGLTYPALPTANGALAGGANTRQFVSLTSPLSSGTKYISFLLKTTGTGDPGGTINGVYFPNGGTGLFFGFGFSAVSATQGRMGIGTMDTTGAAVVNIASPKSTSPSLQTYGTTYFIVLKIDFNTSGGSDTVTAYLNPTANSETPGVPADQSAINTLDVGTITGIGLNSVASMTVDEIRTGTTYASVVGASTAATIPTTLALSVSTGNLIGWSAIGTNYYQPQSSPDNSTWTDLGSLLYGSAVTSAYDPAPGAAFYQVLEIPPVITEEVQNGGFETDNGDPAVALHWGAVSLMPPTRTTADAHTGSASESLYVTNATIQAQVSVLEQNVANAGGAAIIPGNTYTLSFWAKSLPKNPAGGYVQTYNPVWLDGVGGVLGSLLPAPAPTIWADFTSSEGAWTQITPAPAVAPAGAASVLIQIQASNAGIVGDYGGVLIDDVSLTTTTPGTPAVIPSTLTSGTVFIAIVKDNGVTATAATGTVAFKTNSVAQSTTTVAAGSANSTPTAVPASYTVTAIYSGDVTYLGSTNTLVVGSGSGVNATPTNIVASVSGNQLTLSWPADHTGWTLQTQTNSRSAGLGTNWFPVAGSTTTNQMTFTIIPANPTVFYRMTYMP